MKTFYNFFFVWPFDLNKIFELLLIETYVFSLAYHQENSRQARKKMDDVAKRVKIL